MIWSILLLELRSNSIKERNCFFFLKFAVHIPLKTDARCVNFQRDSSDMLKRHPMK